MNLYVGTSGFAYKPWKGGFYPKDLPDKQMLAYYGQQFRAVEINNTFYRMPRSSVLEGWAAQVGADFRFVLKAPRRITHMQRLKDCADTATYLMDEVAALGRRLGAVLYQLPPDFRKDLPRLRDFLAVLPRRGKAAFEFRHASWFDQETFDLLHQRNIALCMAETDEAAAPWVCTADWGYLRLRKSDYDQTALKARMERVKASAWKEAFVFFKHEDGAQSPQLARRFMELA